MALNKTVLRDLIMTKVEATFGTLPAAARPTMQEFFGALSDAIISHITTDGHAVISSTTGGLQKDSTDTLTQAPGTEKLLNLA